MDKLLPDALRPLPATSKLVWLYIHRYPGSHSIRSLQAALGSTAGRALPTLLQAGLLVQEEAPRGRRLGKYRAVSLSAPPDACAGVAPLGNSLPSDTPPVETLLPDTLPSGTEPGTLYSDANFVEVHQLWQNATFGGVWRMVVQLEADAAIFADPDHKLNVRVLHTELWPNWANLDADQASALADVVARWSAVGKKLESIVNKGLKERNRTGFWFLKDETPLPITDPEQLN
ncbi:hypothetical protein E7T06_12800 [Deinococcus sp. Arct2-2]|uniref:hypothetical protein n=1 Tax=Deinococcus sp. Arct2-2 TaxID=2568653 RepID=UPI0010A46129|nr:hypothetical protein [Deinococcus sp. Arct2-2]THF69256.1 hypothetical protein E7T06_12800 [Deinococcus sp. Arct2-2]